MKCQEKIEFLIDDFSLDGGFAEKIVSRVLSLVKAFAKLGDKEARAQHKLVREAERLYLKAAEAAGNGTIKKMILSQVPELEEELTGMNEGETQISEENHPYSYDVLANKQDLIVEEVKLSDAKEAARYRDDTVKFGADMRKIAAGKGNPKNTETATYLYCTDLDEDVLITKDSFKHGGARLDATYLTICKNIDIVLKNSIVVNELNARENTDGGYVLLGLIDTGEHFGIVRSVVNKRTHRLMEFQQLDAIKKQEINKIEDVGLRPPDYPQKRGSATSSVISIAQFISFVKNQNLANEVFSADVAKRIGVQRTQGSLSHSIKFSLKDGANQQTSGDIDELMRSAGIEGDAAEIREDLAELYVKAENLAMDEDSKSGKAFVERVAKRIAGNMARLGTVRDGETQEAMAERLREEILSRSAFADKKAARKTAKEAPKQTPKKEASDEPQPKKTGYTYDDVHAMMDAVKKGLRMNCTKRGRTTASFRLLYTKLYKMQILYN